MLRNAWPLSFMKKLGGPAVTPGSFALAAGRIEKGSSVVTAYPFSLAAWIKPDSSLANTATLTVGSIGAATARLALVDNSSSAGANHIDAFSVNGAGTTAAANGTSNWAPGVWTHRAGVWSVSNNRKTYGDGTLEATNTGGNTTDLTTYIHTVFGGRYNGGSPSSSTMKMAYMGMWDVALSDAEVASLAAGALPTSVQAAHLLIYPIWLGGAAVDQISGATLTTTNCAFDSDLPF